MISFTGVQLLSGGKPNKTVDFYGDPKRVESSLVWLDERGIPYTFLSKVNIEEPILFIEDEKAATEYKLRWFL